MARRNQKTSGASRPRGKSSASAKARRLIDSSAESAWRRTRTLLEEQEVTARIVQLVHDTYGPNALFGAWDAFRGLESEDDGETLLEFTADSPFFVHFASWLAFTWKPAMLSGKRKKNTAPEEVPAQTFLARQPDVDPLVAGYLSTCTVSPFSLFEILKLDAGRSFTCRDLLCGTKHSVIEGTAATNLRVRQILYARIIEVDEPVIDAAAPWALPKWVKPAVLALRADLLEGLPRGVSPARARQRLLERESDVRSFYWGFIEQAVEEDALRSQVHYDQGAYKAAKHVLMIPAPGKTAAEKKTKGKRLPANPEARQQVVSMFTYFCEAWVNLPILGGKTALEAVATPEGRLKVQALVDEMETGFSLLPFPVDPEVFRRVRERLGLSPTKGLH